VTNPPIWQVLWRSDGSSPDALYMALTVRTDQNGAAIASPAEATPRQQFLTAPFAFRAHQSIYATRADGIFDAPQGVQTPAVTSTNGEIALNGSVRLPSANTLYANKVVPQGASPTLRLYAGGGSMAIGYDTRFVFDGNQFYWQTIDAADSISMGAPAGGGAAGTSVAIGGRSINLNSTNVTVRGQPMFVSKFVSKSIDTATAFNTIAHGINTDNYDIFMTGYYSSSSTAVRAAFCYTTSASGRIDFVSNPAAGTIYMWFLGIRKGLTDPQ